MSCDEAREWLGADPAASNQSLPEDIAGHLSGCTACQRYAAEMRRLDGSIRRALEVPLARFRDAASAPAAGPRSQRRPWALAAGVLLAIGAGLGFWALRSAPSLASALTTHMAGEPDSWNQTIAVGQSDVDAVLKASGARIDAQQMPIVYAHSCLFRGRQVPHLVVRTDRGPITVVILSNERVTKAEAFSSEGYQGLLWPAASGHGAIAVLARAGNAQPLDAQAQTLNSQISWTTATR